MRKLRYKGLLLALYVGSAWFAVNAQKAVPIEKEPMHRLKFENEFVRLFDVLIPAGKSSLFHTHLYDGLSIRLSNSNVTEKYAAGTDVVTEIIYGEARFGARPSPMSHQVVATSKYDFRNIFIEILPVIKAAPLAVSPPLTDRHVVLIDNDRVRVSRLVLKPGESSKPHTHPWNGLGIILYDGKLELSGPTGTPSVIEPKAGEFVWQASGTTHVIRNLGKKVFEAIDVEIK
jgi:quercetin dioxygenase-like cupin family protein